MAVKSLQSYKVMEGRFCRNLNIKRGKTDRDECWREPAFSVVQSTPPAVPIEHVLDLDDVTSTEAQFHRVEGHVVPQRLRVDAVPRSGHLS